MMNFETGLESKVGTERHESYVAEYGGLKSREVRKSCVRDTIVSVTVSHLASSFLSYSSCMYLFIFLAV